MSSQNGVYVFCAIREKKPKEFGNVILNGQEEKVYTIHYQNLAIVVSKVDGEVLPDRFNLLAHQQTISKVMKQYSVIPFSFGNVFHSEKDVLLITKHIHEEFEKLFSDIENKIEVGLKSLQKRIGLNRKCKRIQSLSEWKNGNKNIPDPASFYEQIQLGEHAQNFVFLLQD